MKLARRQFLHLGGAAVLPTVSRVARAQAYPTRPVRILVGYAAGGPLDTSARLMAQWLSDRLGQIRRGKPTRRGKQYRDGSGGTSTSRWLYPAASFGVECVECGTLRQS